MRGDLRPLRNRPLRHDAVRRADLRRLLARRGCRGPAADGHAAVNATSRPGAACGCLVTSSAPLRPLRTNAPGHAPTPIALRIPAVAKALGVSTKSVRRLISSGELPASRLIGRTLVVEVRAVEALLRRTRVGMVP